MWGFEVAMTVTMAGVVPGTGVATSRRVTGVTRGMKTPQFALPKGGVRARPAELGCDFNAPVACAGMLGFARGALSGFALRIGSALRRGDRRGGEGDDVGSVPLIECKSGKNGQRMAAARGSKSNRRRAGVSGFRARMACPGGQKVLRARRAKGRKVLCTASDYRGKFPLKHDTIK